MSGWFEVDRKGLAKLLEHRGKTFAIFELVQNAWDEHTQEVEVTLEKSALTPEATLTVRDDNPEGFKDLAHAFTLFAESTKKSDPSKRGRFNLGEKLVLALCREATIVTTTGAVEFSANQGRRSLKRRTEKGSVFQGTLRLTKAEYEHVCLHVLHLLPPEGIRTTFNGSVIPTRKPLRTALVTLPTVIADAEGYLRPTRRQTELRIYQRAPGETATLYEMGIPVVEIGDKFHVEIMQKIPLNTDRDNVTAGYLREIRTTVLNAAYDLIHGPEVDNTWVVDALNDPDVSAEATKHVLHEKYGDRVVAYDPSDPEANKLAVSAGYTVVPGRTFSKQQWETIRSAEALLPAGQVTPSPKPYSPEGTPLKLVPESEWTPAIQRTVTFAQALSKKLFDKLIHVQIAREPTWPFSATYGNGQLTLNLGRIGHKWFEGPRERVVELLLHEFGHEFSSDHLSQDYHVALCRLGAKLTQLALDTPELFAD